MKRVQQNFVDVLEDARVRQNPFDPTPDVSGADPWSFNEPATMGLFDPIENESDELEAA